MYNLGISVVGISKINIWMLALNMNAENHQGYSETSLQRQHIFPKMLSLK